MRQAGTRSNVLDGCCCCCCSTLLVSPLQCTEKKRNMQETRATGAQRRPPTDSDSSLSFKTSSQKSCFCPHDTQGEETVSQIPPNTLIEPFHILQSLHRRHDFFRMAVSGIWATGSYHPSLGFSKQAALTSDPPHQGTYLSGEISPAVPAAKLKLGPTVNVNLCPSAGPLPNIKPHASG